MRFSRRCRANRCRASKRPKRRSRRVAPDLAIHLAAKRASYARYLELANRSGTPSTSAGVIACSAAVAVIDEVLDGPFRGAMRNLADAADREVAALLSKN